MRKKNQLRLNFPEIGVNEKWKVIGYFHGKSTRKSNLKFRDFSQLQFLGRSGDYYHAVADNRFVVVLSIMIK